MKEIYIKNQTKDTSKIETIKGKGKPITRKRLQNSTYKSKK